MKFHRTLTLRHWYYLFGDLDYWYQNDEQDWFDFNQVPEVHWDEQ